MGPLPVPQRQWSLLTECPLAAGCSSPSTPPTLEIVDLDSEDSWGAWGTSLESSQSDMITHLKKLA
eukprot:108406-Amphidinium_carterae.2